MSDERKNKVEELQEKLKKAREAAHTKKEPYAMSESERHLLAAFTKTANAINDPQNYCIESEKGEGQ